MFKPPLTGALGGGAGAVRGAVGKGGLVGSLLNRPGVQAKLAAMPAPAPGADLRGLQPGAARKAGVRQDLAAQRAARAASPQFHQTPIVTRRGMTGRRGR
jgi:hypothetical protein